MDKSLRVLLWYWGRRGGGARYTLEIVRVLSARQDLNLSLSLSRQSELYHFFNDFSVSSRFDVDTYKNIFQFALGFFRLPFLRFYFKRYIKKNNFDVIFCTMDHMWGSFVISSIRDLGLPYLLTVHDGTRHPGEDNFARSWLLKRDIKYSDTILVLSKAVALSLNANYSYPQNRIFLSKHGHFGISDFNLKPRKFPSDRPVRLLFFGRILEYKGLDILLSSLILLRSEFPKLELQIWGTGDIKPYLDLISALGNVHVQNRWINEEEIPNIFLSADLAVLPYREASQSGVAPTAFAYGMPCIATPLPGLCEQVLDSVNGVISKGFSPEDFAFAISKLLRDPLFYNRLSNGCIVASSTTLSWEEISKSVVDALHSTRYLGKRINLN